MDGRGILRSERTASAQSREPAIAIGTCMLAPPFLVAGYDDMEIGDGDTYSSSRMSTCSDEISILDTRMPRLRSKAQNIKEIMCNPQDTSMGKIELFLPSEGSIDFFPNNLLS